MTSPEQITKAAVIDDLVRLMTDVQDGLASVFAAMDWAEDEIEKATRRHPEAADSLYHAFKLIQPRDGMGVEFVYRGHARELLERVATGQDTRPGTAAEVCLVCSKTSQLAPFHTAGVGLYMRMWMQAFPDHPVHDDQAGNQLHYEALRDREIDDLEAQVRRRVADPSRHLRDLTCEGMHHGERVACRYMKPVAIPSPRRPLPDLDSSEQASLFDMAGGDRR